MPSEEVIRKWMIVLVVAIVVPLCTASFFVGRLYTRTSTLKRMVDGHDAIIEGLSSTVIALKTTTDGHDAIVTELSETNKYLRNHLEENYETIQSDIDRLKVDMVTIQKETGSIQSGITELQKNVNTLIEEIRASRPTEGNK